MKILAIIISFLPALLLANSAETAHTPKEILGWSFFNFIILFGVLGYFLKSKLTAMFNLKREEIKAIYTQAMAKQKHAQKGRDNLQTEIANLSNFEDKVMKDTISNTLKFKDHYKTEIDEKIVRVEHESELKIQTTRVNESENVKRELLKTVITDVKQKLEGDSGLKNKVTQKILQNIGQ